MLCNSQSSQLNSILNRISYTIIFNESPLTFLLLVKYYFDFSRRVAVFLVLHSMKIFSATLPIQVAHQTDEMYTQNIQLNTFSSDLCNEMTQRLLYNSLGPEKVGKLNENGEEQLRRTFTYIMSRIIRIFEVPITKIINLRLKMKERIKHKKPFSIIYP